MSAPLFEITLVAVLVSVACALPGVFLVLRRMALLSDAVTHSVLLGIVLMFFLTGDLGSPWLVVGAAAAGIVAVIAIELLSAKRLAPDAAIGLVFPLMFSIGVLLISRYAGGVHLDTDIVLLGELAFVPFDRLSLGGWDLGPRAAYEMGVLVILNAIGITVFFKELKLATFDRALAASLGFSPALIHLLLMTSVSVTAVGAFDAVGSILVVALMIAPPASAYLLTDDLVKMLLLSAAIAAFSAVGGFWFAHLINASIAGSIAVMTGVFFGGCLLFAPRRGVVAATRQRRRNRWRFAEIMLAMHLAHHEATAEASTENRIDHLEEGLHWEPEMADKVVSLAEHHGFIERSGDLLRVTDAGRDLARSALLEA